MPGVRIVHKYELLCPVCHEKLGSPEDRSLLINEDGAVMLFADNDPPQRLAVALVCSHGHVVAKPDDFPFEWWFESQNNAGCKAVVVSGTTASGRCF